MNVGPFILNLIFFLFFTFFQTPSKHLQTSSGAYANIVGTLGEITTFTLSPPGLFYGIRKFGIDAANQLYPYVTSIVPDLDLVPLADFQVGNVQNVPCTAQVESFSDHLKCHSALRTLSLLTLACPDVTHPGREWNVWEEKRLYNFGEGEGSSVPEFEDGESCSGEF